MGRLEGKERLDKPRRRHNYKLSVRSLKMYAWDAFRCVRISAFSTTTPQSTRISVLDFGAVLAYSKIYIFGTRNLNGTETDFYFCDLCVGQKHRMDTSEFHPSACARNRQVNALVRQRAGIFFLNAKWILKLPDRT